MATISASTLPTLSDLSKATDRSGGVTSIVEMLNEKNAVIDSMPYMAGNLPWGTQISVRTGLPVPTWRAINQPVQSSKSEFAQMTFNTAELTQFVNIDRTLANQNGNAAAFRALQDKGAMEAMSQAIANELFYGNEATNPNGFTGLSNYYRSLAGHALSDNVISVKDSLGTGSGTDFTSIWLIMWGEDYICGITPKGMPSGVQARDWGERLLQSSEGQLPVYTSEVMYNGGLCIADWRYAVRLPNLTPSVGVTGITDTTPTFSTLPELMHQAMSRMPQTGSGKCWWYMSRQAKMVFEQSLSRLSAESGLSQEMIGGKTMTTWMGYPIGTCDALSVVEGEVT